MLRYLIEKSSGKEMLELCRLLRAYPASGLSSENYQVIPVTKSLKCCRLLNDADPKTIISI